MTIHEGRIRFARSRALERVNSNTRGILFMRAISNQQIADSTFSSILDEAPSDLRHRRDEGNRVCVSQNSKPVPVPYFPELLFHRIVCFASR